MVRPVLWSPRARRQLDEWVTYLKGEAGPGTAERAFAEVTEQAESLAEYPERFRASELWDGLRELPISFWKRLVVYRVEDARIVILGFPDMRQDLARVRL